MDKKLILSILILFFLFVGIFHLLINQTNVTKTDEISTQLTVQKKELSSDKIYKNEANNTQKVTNTLTEKEMEGILEMAEEEKLAHDVYLTLYNYTKLPVFKNIAERSETQHMKVMEELIKKYGLENPIENMSLGKFQSEKYQNLYDQLVNQGKKSIVDAILVGLTIEDLDIADLENWKKYTNKSDIIESYDFLIMGSRNHMRAFYRVLKNYGGNYTPQYISEKEFEEIINSPMERNGFQSQFNNH